MPEDSFPPPEPIPSGPPPAAPQAQYRQPPPFGAPVGFAPRPRRPWLPWLIAAIAIVVAGTLVAAVFGAIAVVRTAQEFTVDSEDFPDQPPTIQKLVEGDPASPLAVAPDDCADPCFGVASISRTIPDESAYEQLKMTEILDSWGDYASSTPREEQSYTQDYWSDAEASPEECYFSYLNTPVVATIDEVVAGNDRVDYTGTRTTEDVQHADPVGAHLRHHG